MNAVSPRARVLLRALALCAILALGAYLRFVNLRLNPAWYPDEGSNLDVALNLLAGRYQYFAVGGSALLEGRPPLFHFLLALALQVLGRDIFAARALAASAGCLAILLLYLATRLWAGDVRALLAAFILAILPDAVAYNRLGLSYNLLLPLYVLCAWALFEFAESRRMCPIAALSAGIAVITDLVALPLVLCVLAIVAAYERRRLPLALFLTLAPIVFYAGVMLMIAPQAFAEDLRAMAFRSSNSVVFQLAGILAGYALFLQQSLWNVLGVVGFFLIEPRRGRVVVLLIFFATLFNLVRFAPAHDLGYYRVIELLPFIALGVAIFIARALPFALGQITRDVEAIKVRRTFRSLTVALTTFLLVASPLAMAVVMDVLQAQTRFATTGDRVSATRPLDAIAATDFVNARVAASDVVLASPQVAWRVNARVADFQQALAFQGYPVENFPLPISKSRFAFDPLQARYVIVDNFWRDWGARTLEGMPELLQTIAAWRMIYQVGEYSVYQNPVK